MGVTLVEGLLMTNGTDKQCSSHFASNEIPKNTTILVAKKCCHFILVKTKLAVCCLLRELVS